MNTISGGGGLCIDHPLGVSAACAASQVDITFGPSCSISPPFASDFNTNDGEFRFQTGFWYTDSGVLYGGAGTGYTVGHAGTCIPTLEDAPSRTFSATIANLNGAQAGMYFSEKGGTRIVAISGDSNLYSEDTITGVMTPIGTIAAPGLSMAIAVTNQNIGGVAIPDDLWDENGAAGLVVRDGPTVEFSSYSVA